MRSVVFVVVTLLASLATADDDRCAWGESYWCSDLRAAKACGAIQHCKTTVWKNQVLTQDSSDVCEFCQTIVGDVHKFISDKKTEEDIANFLTSACSVLPTPDVVAECKKLVQEYVPEIIDLITSEMTPQVVCSLLKLCKGFQDTAQHYPVLHHVPLEKDAVTLNKEPICTDCKKFIVDIRNMISSKEYEQQIEKMIDDNLCPYFGSFESECKTLVKRYLPQLLNMTAQYYDPNVICQGFCAKDGPKTAADFESLKKLHFFEALRKARSAEGCMLCKTVLAELQALLRDTKIQLAIENFLKDDICSHMGRFANVCKEDVGRWAPAILELLVTALDPESRCTSFGLCPGSDKDSILAATARKIENKKRVTPNPSPECVMCEFVMKELDSLLTDKTTEAEIIAALDKVCSLLPKTITVACTDFVNTYGPAIIALLQQELDPAQVCTFLGLCSAKQTVTTPVKVGDSETCVICETIVQYVESLIEENATVTDIEKVVKKICNFLPETMRQQCTAIVNEYGPIIIHLIATKFSPKEVCTLAKLCTDEVGSLPMMNLVPSKQKLLGANECTWGPAYWCANQQNAELCGMVEHCKKTVWKK